jgi:hypothetical protein
MIAWDFASGAVYSNRTLFAKWTAEGETETPVEPYVPGEEDDEEKPRPSDSCASATLADGGQILLFLLLCAAVVLVFDCARKRKGAELKIQSEKRVAKTAGKTEIMEKSKKTGRKAE